MNPYRYLPDSAQIILSRRDLDHILGIAHAEGRGQALQEAKEALGFNRNISFDGIPAIVKGWKEAAEAANNPIKE